MHLRIIIDHRLGKRDENILVCGYPRLYLRNGKPYEKGTAEVFEHRDEIVRSRIASHFCRVDLGDPVPSLHLHPERGIGFYHDDTVLALGIEDFKLGEVKGFLLYVTVSFGHDPKGIRAVYFFMQVDG